MCIRDSLKSVEGEGLVHHGLGEFGVLLPGPEQHFLPLLRPHVARLPGRIHVQAIKPGCVVAVSYTHLAPMRKTNQN